MIKFNEQELTQNQAAKVLLSEALVVVRENMSEEFKSHVGLDLELVTGREYKEIQNSISKWCDRLMKSLNMNFEYSPSKSESAEEQEEEIEYFQLKSGGFAAKGCYYEE
jgi:hypothetical protein